MFLGILFYAVARPTTNVKNERDWHIAWSSKLIHTIGASFIENGSKNKPLLNQINLNIGFYRAEFYFLDKFQFRSRIKPISFALNLYALKGNRFDLNKSLLYGTPIYTTQDENLPNASAITYGNSIVFRESLINNILVSNHEIIHVFQYDEFVGFNSFSNKIKNDNKWLNKLDKSFLYLDIHALPFYLFYFTDELIQGRSFNFLEREAYYFSDPR